MKTEATRSVTMEMKEKRCKSGRHALCSLRLLRSHSLSPLFLSQQMSQPMFNYSNPNILFDYRGEQRRVRVN